MLLRNAMVCRTWWHRSSLLGRRDDIRSTRFPKQCCLCPGGSRLAPLELLVRSDWTG